MAKINTNVTAGIHAVKEITARRWIVEVVNGGLKHLLDIRVVEIGVAEVARIEPAERVGIANKVFTLPNRDHLEGIDGTTRQCAIGRRGDINSGAWGAQTIIGCGRAANLDLILLARLGGARNLEAIAAHDDSVWLLGVWEKIIVSH